MSDSSDNNLDILVPNLPESVTDATVSIWYKKKGDIIQQDEILLELETDKIMLEVPAARQGILESILEKEGSVVVSGQKLGNLKLIQQTDDQKKDLQQHTLNQDCHKSNFLKNIITDGVDIQNKNNKDISISPSIRKLIAEYNLNINDIKGSGIKGRLTKKDVEIYIQKYLSKKNDECEINLNKNIHNDLHNNHVKHNHITSRYIDNRKDTRVTMSRLRKKIAERLLKVTNSTAMLTTFNEVNMRPVIILRNKYKDSFEQRYGIKLGFMSFYIKAVLEGLKRFPEINSYIDEEEIVYHNYFDISIAVSTDRGLVTPVLKDVNQLSFSEIEKQIQVLAKKSREGKLKLEELIGGNFTITNGGIFGSLISTPIINPPQSAILGMHVIKDRPVVLNQKIVILPMMYLALSYDHRLIDGKDAVNFLITIKELIENPIRLLLEI